MGRDDTLRIVKAVGSLPAAVLPALLARAPLTPEKVTFAWAIAVGAAMARATEVLLVQGTLQVHASDAAWTREVQRSAPLILARVQGLLGRGLVHRLTVSPEGNGGT